MRPLYKGETAIAESVKRIHDSITSCQTSVAVRTPSTTASFARRMLSYGSRL